MGWIVLRTKEALVNKTKPYGACEVVEVRVIREKILKSISDKCCKGKNGVLR